LFDIFVLFGLAFADDLVIIAKNERGTKEMMKNLGKYVRKKKLEVNVKKKWWCSTRERGRVKRISGTAKEGK
jgi:hypothetical protein